MKTFAFEQWCDQIPTGTRDFLIRLRSSPPARRVQGRLLNVCGTYASRKMGVSIQFESHTVELWAIYMMEYDRAVLEFFDQPCQLELHYQGPSSRPAKALHTPDFLVLRTDGASFEEWKPEEKLLELMVTHPGRYQGDDDGRPGRMGCHDLQPRSGPRWQLGGASCGISSDSYHASCGSSALINAPLPPSFSR